MGWSETVSNSAEALTMPSVAWAKTLSSPVVGGSDDHAVQLKQFLQQGTGEGCALGGVGTGAEFVKQDEGARSGGLDDPHDIGHVGGEGGERLFD